MKKLLTAASLAFVCAFSFAQPQPKVVTTKKVEATKKVEEKKNVPVDKYHDNVDDRMKGPKGEKVYIGPNGGRYYLTPAGNKVYVPLKKTIKKP